MIFLDWYRQYLQIKFEARERQLLIDVDKTVCKSCETLRTQLEAVNYEKTQLLSKILKEPEPIIEAKEGPKITIPKSIPWGVRRQLLEKEDREKARLMRDAPKPVSTEDLERELNIVQNEREAQIK